MASTNKTSNYNLNQYIGTDTLQRVDYNADMLAIDNALTPTADPTQAPTGLTGKLSQWVSWFTNRIKTITGKSNWYDAPTKNMEQLNSDISTLNTNKLAKSGDTIQNYSETVVTKSTALGTISIDLSTGNVFDITLFGNTTFTFDNVPTGKNCSFTIYINQGATSKTVTFPASVKWANDQIPDISTINKTHIVFMTTKNGGTRWYGSCIANFTT